ncbi:glycosyltransferase family 4 protein [Nonlabens sp. SCSIO 43208]|uniref:glycosyltransferase family 4 protein n=1 Tax=Nonlabens sp. SCSIO 43208 TaxID=2793009 RepID=UPI003D6AB701
MSSLKKRIKFLFGYFLFLSFKTKKIPKIVNSDIIFFLPYYHLGGAEQVHLDIIKAISNKQVTVIFTHLSATNHFKEKFSSHAYIIELNSIINKKSSFLNKKLFKTIARAINSSESITKVLGCNTDYFYEILPLLNKPAIDLIHSIAPNDTRKAMFAEADSLLSKRIVINNYTRNQLYEIVKTHTGNITQQNKINVIPNGVEINNNYLSDNDLKYRIGFIGRWSLEKRPELFLELAKKLKIDFPHLEFVMAGSAMNLHDEEITKAGVKNLGSIKDKQKLKNIYKSLDFLIITSTYEGFPMVMMESMPFGVIPVCTDVGGIHEHINHEVNGFLINEEQNKDIVLSMVNLISYLYQNQKIISKISEETASYASQNFDIEKFNDSYKKLLLE